MTILPFLISKCFVFERIVGKFRWCNAVCFLCPYITDTHINCYSHYDTIHRTVKWRHQWGTNEEFCCLTHGLCRSSEPLPKVGPGRRSYRVWGAWNCAWSWGCGGTYRRPCRWSSAASKSPIRWGYYRWIASPGVIPDTCTARTQVSEQLWHRIPAQPEYKHQNSRNSGHLHSLNTIIRTVVTSDTCTAWTQLSDQP